VDITHGRILYLEDVSVSFDGFKAINKLSLDIAPGELRCIIGPNGAGKTTMMDIITGKTRPDEGTVFFGSTIDLLRYKSRDRPAGHRPQVPEAHGVRAAHRVREPGAGAQDPQGRGKRRCCSAWTGPERPPGRACCTPSTWPTA
jgi:ATPase subunit of ABC transporter with duplicated ATPase domains